MSSAFRLVVRGLPKTSHPGGVIVLLGLTATILYAQLLLPTLIVLLSRLLDCPGTWPVSILGAPIP